jgi:hypothetical protein
LPSLAILSVPLVVAALVLLIAFAGCDQVFGLDPIVGHDYDDGVTSHPSLVSFWHLGEPTGPVAADSKGGHHGTYVSGPLAPDLPDGSAGAPGTLTFSQPGLISSEPAKLSIYVDGGRVEVPFTPDLNTAAFTVVAWVRTGWTESDPVAYRAVLDSRDQLAGGQKFGYALFANIANEWSAWIGDGTTGPYRIASTGGTIALGTTDYLAMTYDGTLKMYVNGEERASLSAPLGVNAARPLFIGEGAPMLPTPFFPFAGNIAEVSYFNEALDHEAIVDIGMGSA